MPDSSLLALGDYSMECRPGCGACCIFISISSSLPGLPNGKAAGVVCPHLSEDYLCLIFNREDRPQVCADLQASPEMCGSSKEEAENYLQELELMTRPEKVK